MYGFNEKYENYPSTRHRKRYNPLAPDHGPFFSLISSLDGDAFANVHVKGIVEFKH